MGRYFHRERWLALAEDEREAIRARVRAGVPYSVIQRATGFCRVMLRKLCPRPAPVKVDNPKHTGNALWDSLSDADKASIRSKVAAGDSYTEMAREIGIPRRTLARRCPRPAGTPRKSAWARLPLEVKASVISRVLAGETLAALSRECGVAASTLQANIRKAIERSKPKAHSSVRVFTPHQIAEKIRRAALARRADQILRRSGLPPTSRLPRSAPIPITPAPHVIRPARHFPAARKAVDVAPIAPRALPRGDQPVMDLACWGTGEADR